MRRQDSKVRAWKQTSEMCPHCGHKGLEAGYKRRRLVAEQCPDCGRSWQHMTRSRARL